MKKPTLKRSDRGRRPEYDFSGGVRGKYPGQFKSGTNLVLLEPNIARAFPDAKSVNAALRALITLAKRANSRSTRRPTTA
jgi:hypothetical protein